MRMAKKQPVPEAPATDSGPLFELRCRLCKRPVTRPLRLAPTDTKVSEREKEHALPEGIALLPPLGLSLIQHYNLDHGVIVNVNELLNTSCPDGAFGCCGYSGSSGPNLLCKYNHVIGTRIDDCIDPHFAHLSLQYCELFPLSGD